MARTSEKQKLALALLLYRNFACKLDGCYTKATEALNEECLERAKRLGVKQEYLDLLLKTPTFCIKRLE